ncbi:YihY/virulence factor BrkB family protein [Sphingomicrobium aestuariivivum]|uniref:YihY/virulence factor BrkB family protein n=1 Tax=Sphingomicrobium aestuariivivum TaxID=1582356 RepID=UPI001FD7210A|nr:YihY/virulence factor BrkB family protein [Sphingomicrobium aestuariivivum]MCJ8190505.1 YihY/virulence factor BrkB family protein [Sphingomicrobium aestuariivivum]
MQLIADLKAAFARSGRNRTTFLAAGVAFYGFLALVPTIAAVVIGYGLFADRADAVVHAEALTRLLPPAAAEIVTDQMRKIAAIDGNKTALGFVVALGTVLYSASKGGKAVLVALNIIEGVEESRGFVRQVWTGLGITLIGIAGVLVALAAISVLGYAEAMIPGLPDEFYALMRVGLWVVLVIGAIAGLGWLYARAPNGPVPPLSDTIPGAILAAVILLGATLGFAIYVAQFGNYNATYGALGAVVILQLWIYLSAYAVLFGDEYNMVRAERGAG